MSHRVEAARAAALGYAKKAGGLHGDMEVAGISPAIESLLGSLEVLADEEGLDWDRLLTAGSEIAEELREHMRTKGARQGAQEKIRTKRARPSRSRYFP